MAELNIKNIEKVVEKGFEKQAILINNAFQTHSDHFDEQIADLKDELKTDIQRVETKVDKALHAEYVNLEVRIKRIENKLGLKPLNDSTQTAS